MVRMRLKQNIVLRSSRGGVVEGELWPSTSSSDYELMFDGEGDSDGQVSLVAESGVGGEMWESMGNEEEVVLEHPKEKGSNLGV